jgi:hypothetical protein
MRFVPTLLYAVLAAAARPGLLGIAAAGGAATTSAATTKAQLSNLVLPRDTAGRELTTGEADVLHHNGSYYFFFNNWDSCPGRDCCNTSGGCWSCCFRGGGSNARQRFPFASVTSPPQPPDPDCTDWFNHTVVAYRSSDLVSFESLGTVFAPKFAVQQGVIIYRPHVLWSPKLQQFVMWYKTLDKRENPKHWYGVAAADSVAGPFEVLVEKVPGITGSLSDHFLFVDDADGSAYLVWYHSIQRLNATFTGVEPGARAALPNPASWEAPVMFKRGGRYFVIGGHNCCACRGGSNAYVFTAPLLGSPLGNWSFVGDIGDNRTECALQEPPVCTRGGRSPYQWITHAQTAAAFTVAEEGKQDETVVLLSNQWVTAPPPRHARNADLLYWTILEFNESTGLPLHLQWQDSLTLTVAPPMGTQLLA